MDDEAPEGPQRTRGTCGAAGWCVLVWGWDWSGGCPSDSRADSVVLLGVNLLLEAVQGAIAGLAVIAIVAVVRWSRGFLRTRRAAKSAQVEAERESVRRIAQRRRVAARNHANALLLQETRLPSRIGAGDPWSTTTATGYGVHVRDESRRRGLTPADYVRGR
jgi:hypothetical protein